MQWAFCYGHQTEILNLDEMLHQTIEESNSGKNVHTGFSSGIFRAGKPQICNSLICFCSLDQFHLHLADREEAGTEGDAVRWSRTHPGRKQNGSEVIIKLSLGKCFLTTMREHPEKTK